ncbi:hypothetical protein V1289_002934 [Bradyrhizobium sp. AZCC 2289]
MGVVRSAIRFPHTFYVVAAPILFLGITAGIQVLTEILRTRDLTMKGVQFSKVASFWYGARLDRRLPHRSALLSNGRNRSLSSPRRMRRRKSTGTSPPTSRRRKWSISRSAW